MCILQLCQHPQFHHRHTLMLRRRLSKKSENYLLFERYFTFTLYLYGLITLQYLRSFTQESVCQDMQNPKRGCTKFFHLNVKCFVNFFLNIQNEFLCQKVLGKFLSWFICENRKNLMFYLPHFLGPRS